MRQYTVATIKKNIFAAMMFFPFIPFIFAISVVFYLYDKFENQYFSSNVSYFSNFFSDKIDLYIDDCLDDISFASKFLYDDNGKIYIHKVLASLQSKRREFLDAALLDRDGNVIAYAGPLIFSGSHVSVGSWLSESLEKGFGIGDIQSSQMGSPHFILARRVSQGNSTYVLRMSLDASVFDRMLREASEGLDLFLVNRDGMLVAGVESAFARERELSRSIIRQRPGTVFFDSESEFAYTSRVLRHLGWVLVARKHFVSTFTSGDSVFLLLVLSVFGGVIVFFSALSLSAYVEKMLRQRDEERERLREQLYRAGRLAELGEMAAGFAHEINNPLQIMKSDQAYIEMVLDEFRERCSENTECMADICEISTSIAQIKVQIDRCARITHSILRFGRSEKLDIQHVDLAKFIPDVLTMLNKKIQISNIKLKIDISSSKMIVNVDPGRLQQVLLNLINNAIYAIQENKDRRDGEISLSCGIDMEDRIRIQVVDNGIGITPDNQKLIFTPFFTTKPPGQGTGLGLSVCHDLVDGMNGVLDFVSRTGEGTTFSVTLPRVRPS